MLLSMCGVAVGLRVPRMREIVVVYIEIKLVEVSFESGEGMETYLAGTVRA
jgi:hypothetical protein